VTTGLPLHRALAGLRHELELAQAESGDVLGLRIDSIQLELSLQLDMEAHGKGAAAAEAKLPWLVVGKALAEADAKAAASHIHRLSLKITPTSARSENAPVSARKGDGDAATPSEQPQNYVSPFIVADDQLRRDPAADEH
jgi:hypothetical protein